MNKMAVYLICQIALCTWNIASACTLAFWNTNKITPIVGRTMDLYMSDQPKIVVYPQGVERDGMAGANSYHWKAKYGSMVITAFNSPGVSEGMNEYGLGASLLYLHDTNHEQRDTKIPGVANAMWAQYVLDNFKTVQEFIDHIKQVQIVSVQIGGREWPLHLVVEDPSGDSAVIEFVNHKMTVHHGKQYNIVANEPAYDLQLANLKKYKLFGGHSSMPGDIDSLSRFVRASSYMKTLPEPNDATEAAGYLMGVMRTVMVPYGAQDTSGSESADTWPTRWVSIKDLKNKMFYFSATKNPNVIWINYANLTFNSGSKTLSLNPEDPTLSGEVSGRLKPQ